MSTNSSSSSSSSSSSNSLSMTVMTIMMLIIFVLTISPTVGTSWSSGQYTTAQNVCITTMNQKHAGTNGFTIGYYNNGSVYTCSFDISKTFHFNSQ